MHSNTIENAAVDAEFLLSDDIASLKRNIKTGSFDYIDIASFTAWQEALKQWPLLAEWDAWSQR